MAEPELGLALASLDEGTSTEVPGLDDAAPDNNTEAALALEEAMPDADPENRDAMKRAIEACVAAYMSE